MPIPVAAIERGSHFAASPSYGRVIETVMNTLPAGLSG